MAYLEGAEIVANQSDTGIAQLEHMLSLGLGDRIESLWLRCFRICGLISGVDVCRHAKLIPRPVPEAAALVHLKRVAHHRGVMSKAIVTATQLGLAWHRPQQSPKSATRCSSISAPAKLVPCCQLHSCDAARSHGAAMPEHRAGQYRGNNVSGSEWSDFLDFHIFREQNHRFGPFHWIDINRGS